MAKHINPFTDFGFKCIFGREESKPFLMDFLNELLKEEPGFGTITDICDLDTKEPVTDRLRLIYTAALFQKAEGGVPDGFRPVDV